MLTIEPGTKNGVILRTPPCRYAIFVSSISGNAADARADAHADALLVARIVVEPGIAHRLHRGDEPEMDERVVAPRFLRRQVLADVEILDLAAIRDGNRCIETCDRAMPERARMRPRRDADADRRDDPSPVTTTRRRPCAAGTEADAATRRDDRRAVRLHDRIAGRARHFFRCELM